MASKVRSFDFLLAIRTLFLLSYWFVFALVVASQCCLFVRVLELRVCPLFPLWRVFLGSLQLNHLLFFLNLLSFVGFVHVICFNWSSLWLWTLHFVRLNTLFCVSYRYWNLDIYCLGFLDRIIRVFDIRIQDFWSCNWFVFTIWLRFFLLLSDYFGLDCFCCGFFVTIYWSSNWTNVIGVRSFNRDWSLVKCWLAEVLFLFHEILWSL